MDLQRARKIISAYGEYIECTRWSLNAIFFYNIPESLLPYSVELTTEACNVVADHYFKNGEKETVEDIERCMVWLGEFKDDEEAILGMLEKFKIQKWYDLSLKQIKDFRNVNKSYFSKFFKEVPFEKVDFDNLTFYTAGKVVEVYSRYLRHVHMCFFLIFSQKIPESLLPFPREDLVKAVTFYVNLHESKGDEELSKEWMENKDILDEDFVSDEVAMRQLVKNFSDREVRDSIIHDIKKYQLEGNEYKNI